MRTTIDAAGRLVVPKVLRDVLGLTAGSELDVSVYGHGLAVLPITRTARLERRDGRLVAVSDTAVDDEAVFALLDAGRR